VHRHAISDSVVGARQIHAHIEALLEIGRDPRLLVAAVRDKPSLVGVHAAVRDPLLLGGVEVALGDPEQRLELRLDAGAGDEEEAGRLCRLANLRAERCGRALFACEQRTCQRQRQRRAVRQPVGRPASLGVRARQRTPASRQQAQGGGSSQRRRRSRRSKAAIPVLLGGGSPRSITGISSRVAGRVSRAIGSSCACAAMALAAAAEALRLET